MSQSDSSQGQIGQLFEIVIDVSDLDRSVRFWSEVLGLKEAHRWGQYLGFEKLDNGLVVALQKVTDKKTSKNRMHMDIAVDDVDIAATRVESLGGSKLQEVEEAGIRWAVMADPDGNEFCLIPKADIAAVWTP
jgi:predicted enzyme related to lactoylglutathione lyase